MKKILSVLVLASIFAAYTTDVQSARKIPKKILKQFANSQIANVFFPTYQKLEATSYFLKNEIAVQCSNPATFSRQAIKQKYVDYVKAYHFSEAFQIGRVARNAGELRERLYSFPNSNTYLMDIEVASVAANPAHTYQNTPTAIGMAALDYLIYEESLQNGCASCGQALLESWNLLSEADKLASRCQYMTYVSEKMHLDSQAITASWSPVNGDFLKSESFKTDIISWTEFASQLTKHLNFLDRQIKDQRIGIPSGYLTELCGFDSCPERSEHIDSGLSITSLIYSLKGFIAVLNAGPVNANYDLLSKGFGFNELLANVGKRNIANEMENRIRNVIAILENNSSSSIFELAQNYTKADCLASTSSDRKVEVCALYSDIKTVTDYYKADFLLAVDLGKPDEGSGDSD